ncbi:MAG: hypothetical protein LBF59_10410 [Prevotellaceae bacterium]|jgi:hypothetical protein|nr:hypothetical protein [Prevotellaceae bacterium]
MRKFIYNSIVERLKTVEDENGEQAIKHFDLWNSQVKYAEQPFGLPAVFLGFRSINWRLTGNSVREAVVTVELHVITQRNMPTSSELPCAETPLDFFDLLAKINVCLYQYANRDDRFEHNALTPVQSTTDHDCGELRDDIEVFECHAVDASAMPDLQKKTVKMHLNI